MVGHFYLAFLLKGDLLLLEVTLGFDDDSPASCSDLEASPFFRRLTHAPTAITKTIKPNKIYNSQDNSVFGPSCWKRNASMELPPLE